MADRYTSRVAVTLAAGASSSTAHNIVRGGVATAPQLVLPDRMTTIQVDTVDATNINCSNPGTNAATVVFWVEYRHSIQATPAMTAPGIFWKGGTGGGVGASVPFQNDYYFDPDATDDAGARLYNDVETLLTAADTALPAGMGIVVHLHSAVSNADWGSFHLPFLPAGRSVMFIGDSPTSEAGVFMEGVAPASAAACTLAFKDCQLQLDAACTLGTNRSLTLQNVTATLDGGTITMAAGTVFSATDSIVSYPRIIGLGAGLAGVLLLRSSVASVLLADVAPILFDNVLLSTITGCEIQISESNWTMFRRVAGGTASFFNVSADLTNSGAGAARLCDNGAGTGSCEDFRITRSLNTGGGTTSLGLAAASSSGAGLHSTNVRTVGSGATAVSTLDGTILCDASGGTSALTLPDADSVPSGTQIIVKRIDPFDAASANDVTIAVPGANTIDGQAGPLSMKQYALDLPVITLSSSTTGTGAWHVTTNGGKATVGDSTFAAGNATLHTSSGTSTIALGASTCVITNGFVTAGSRVLVQLETADATLTRVTVVPGAGSFTVTGNGVATANTDFSWVVIPGIA
jgi:hypothetical protein